MKKPTFGNLVILQQPPWSFVESPLQRYSPTLAQHTVSSLPPLSLFLRIGSMGGNWQHPRLAANWKVAWPRASTLQSRRGFNNNLVLGRVDNWMSRDQHNTNLWLGKRKTQYISKEFHAAWCASAAGHDDGRRPWQPNYNSECSKDHMPRIIPLSFTHLNDRQNKPRTNMWAKMC